MNVARLVSHRSYDRCFFQCCDSCLRRERRRGRRRRRRRGGGGGGGGGGRTASDGCDVASSARPSLLLNGWAEEKKKKGDIESCLSDVLVVDGSLSRTSDKQRGGTTGRQGGELNDTLLLVVCISFRQLVDRLLVDQSRLTCRVHTNGEAPLQAAVRAPIAPGFVHEAGASPGWKNKTHGIAMFGGSRRRDGRRKWRSSEKGPRPRTRSSYTYTGEKGAATHRPLEEAGTTVAAVNSVVLPVRSVAADSAGNWRRQCSPCAPWSRIPLIEFGTFLPPSTPSLFVAQIFSFSLD